MNSLQALPALAAIVVSILLFIGGTIVLIGALGLLRLPTFYQRIHGPAIIISLGSGALLLASMVYFSVLQSRVVVHELVITAFIVMTAPVVSMLLMRAAVYRDMRAGKTNIDDPDGLFGEQPDTSTQHHQAP